MIDWLIHHSEIVSLKADSFRLPGEYLDARPHDAPTNGAPLGATGMSGPLFNRPRQQPTEVLRERYQRQTNASASLWQDRHFQLAAMCVSLSRLMGTVLVVTL